MSPVLRAALLGLVLVACGDDRPRCSACGMYADTAPAWAVGARTRSGEEVRFDAPRCFFARALRERDLVSPWVTEYYSQSRQPAEKMAFVEGSDVTGPMGRDLVPVNPVNVPRFVQEHGGRSLPFEAIDAAVLGRLDP